MKTLFIAVSFLGFAASCYAISEEARLDIAEFANVPESNVTLENKVLKITTNKKTLNKKYAQHLMVGVCEFVALEPNKWKGTTFSYIEIRNSSNNQGYRNNIPDSSCRLMINKNFSDDEIDRWFFKSNQMNKF